MERTTRALQEITFSPVMIIVVLKLFLAIQLCVNLSFTKGMSTSTINEYMQARNAALEADTSTLLGGSMRFDDFREVVVNQILMSFKEKEYDEGLASNGRSFPGAQHFFLAKPMIDKSDVFKIIRMMPKGTGLHMHCATDGKMEFIAINLTRWDKLWYCLEDENHLHFRFFEGIAPAKNCSQKSLVPWKTVESLRMEMGDDWVDNFFLSSMSMITKTPKVDYPDTNAAWETFEKNIETLSGIINYEQALRANYYNNLQHHYDDNVMYIEMRGFLAMVYHLNQSELNVLETLQLYKEVTDQFMADHPDFWGAKFIYAPHRNNKREVVKEMVKSASVMKELYPDYFVGFDLVGQEDKGKPLVQHIPELLEAAKKNIKFFFHSGETDWHGTKIDENLIDAVLLNTTRIAHGYALSSHPYLYNMVKKNGIAVEVCPISNQVLGLVDDLRNHPATNYFRDGFPVVVASDGPSMWGASALSHDIYMAFMAIGGRKADLRFLKQLAINSIQYSAMSALEKQVAFSKWEKQWDEFLSKVMQLYSHQE